MALLSCYQQSYNLNQSILHSVISVWLDSLSVGRIGFFTQMFTLMVTYVFTVMFTLISLSCLHTFTHIFNHLCLTMFTHMFRYMFLGMFMHVFIHIYIHGYIHVYKKKSLFKDFLLCNLLHTFVLVSLKWKT
jgi:hypothetical protein